MTITSSTTATLGDEYDHDLRARLLDVLRKLGASIQHPADWSIAGSQELEEFTVVVDGQALRVEVETYVGLSISGPTDLVTKIRNLVAAKNRPEVE
jgi:hypothetical protein